MNIIPRRSFLLRLLQLPVFFWLSRSAFAAQAFAKPLLGRFKTTRIAFGSCAYQDEPQPIWNAIAKTKPDVFAFIGDNIYGDSENMDEVAAKYAQLGAIPEFANFRRQVPIVATWDDHDFGANDAGREYPMKNETKNLMLRFFNEPEESPRWNREGVYTSYVYGSHPRKLQIILLDLRWFRSPLVGRPHVGYSPDPSSGATILGSEQWAWLEEQLKVPADFRILASSSQLISSEHVWEKWANFPREKERLIKLIDNMNIKNLVVISGDMHFGELSKETTPNGHSIYDLTSSGLNIAESAATIVNSKRLALYDNAANFGLITVNWKARQARLEVRNHHGHAVIREFVSFKA